MSCFKYSVGFWGLGPKGLTRGWSLNPVISSPYIVRQLDHRVGADCLSGAGLGVAHPAEDAVGRKKDGRVLLPFLLCKLTVAYITCPWSMSLTYIFFFFHITIYEKFQLYHKCSAVGTRSSQNPNVVRHVQLLNIKQLCVKSPAVYVLARRIAADLWWDTFAACLWPCFFVTSMATGI